MKHTADKVEAIRKALNLNDTSLSEIVAQTLEYLTIIAIRRKMNVSEVFYAKGDIREYYFIVSVKIIDGRPNTKVKFI